MMCCGEISSGGGAGICGWKNPPGHVVAMVKGGVVNGDRGRKSGRPSGGGVDGFTGSGAWLGGGVLGLTGSELKAAGAKQGCAGVPSPG